MKYIIAAAHIQCNIDAVDGKCLCRHCVKELLADGQCGDSKKLEKSRKAQYKTI